MRRYKTYSDSERQFLKISLMPKEFELSWTMILGVWITVMLGKDIIIYSYGIFGNLFNLVFLVAILILFLGLLSSGFNEAFRTGNLNAYAFLIWMSFFISLLLIDNCLKSCELNELKNIYTLRERIFFIFHSFWIPFVGMVFINLIYWGIKILSSKENTNNKLKTWIPILILIIGSLLIGVFSVLLYFKWAEIMQSFKLFEVIKIITENEDFLETIQYRLYVTCAIIILVITRVIGTELFYMLNKKRVSFRSI